MTTDVLASDGLRRRPSAGRLGALAAGTPIAMFLAWNAIAGWGGTAGEFVLASAEITLGAVVAGWIVGDRVGHSVAGHILGLVAYAFVGELVVLPINVVGSMLGDLQAGRVSGPLEIVGAACGYLLYGLVSGLYMSVFLLPFGVAWMVTFVLLRWMFQR